LTYNNTIVILPLVKANQLGGNFMWTKPKSLYLSSFLIKLFIVLLVICTFTLPFIVSWYIDVANKEEIIFYPLLVTLYSSLVPFAIALLCLNRLLENVKKGLVFVQDNVKAMRLISWCCFAVTFIFIVFGFYYILSLLLSIMAALVGLMLRVLKNLFEQAIAIKEENDFTI